MGLKPETSYSLGMGLFFLGGNLIEIYTLEDSKKGTYSHHPWKERNWWSVPQNSNEDMWKAVNLWGVYEFGSPEKNDPYRGEESDFEHL